MGFLAFASRALPETIVRLRSMSACLIHVKTMGLASTKIAVTIACANLDSLGKIVRLKSMNVVQVHV